MIQFAGGLNVLDWNKQVTPTPTALCLTGFSRTPRTSVDHLKKMVRRNVAMINPLERG